MCKLFLQSLCMEKVDSLACRAHGVVSTTGVHQSCPEVGLHWVGEGKVAGQFPRGTWPHSVGQPISLREEHTPKWASLLGREGRRQAGSA